MKDQLTGILCGNILGRGRSGHLLLRDHLVTTTPHLDSRKEEDVVSDSGFFLRLTVRR